jgi:hypothetical protein
MKLDPSIAAKLPKLSAPFGMPVAIPQHAQLAQAGFPPELIEFLRSAAATGWLICACKLKKPWKDGEPLPEFECRLERKNFPYDLLLSALALMRHLIHEIDPYENSGNSMAKRVNQLEQAVGQLLQALQGTAETTPSVTEEPTGDSDAVVIKPQMNDDTAPGKSQGQ